VCKISCKIIIFPGNYYGGPLPYLWEKGPSSIGLRAFMLYKTRLLTLSTLTLFLNNSNMICKTYDHIAGLALAPLKYRDKYCK